MSKKKTPPTRVPPGFRSVAVPDKYRKHPQLQGPSFFTVPRRLLELVEKEVGKNRFDLKVLEMEYELSDICGDHGSRIGFWGWAPVAYTLLRESNVQVDEDYLTAWGDFSGKSVEETRRSLKLASDRLGRFRTVQRGFLGWLITNPEFLQDQVKIFKKWSTRVAKVGVPVIGPAVHNAQLVPGAAEATGSMAEFLTDFEVFFIRWRLQGMPAAFAPVPLGPHMPVLDLRPLVSHMKEGGTSFYFPDIFPVPSRDELRDMLEDALRPGAAPEHLAEWFDIVGSGNTSRNQIPKFARVFEVQHYVRCLHSRHEDALKRKLSALKSALADFLDVDFDTIDNDTKLIARRLNCTGWYLKTA